MGWTAASLRLNPHWPTFLINIRALANKIDKLCLWITWKMLIECNIMIFIETWLSSNMPNNTIKPEGLNIFRTDRIVVDTGKGKAGGGCIFVNEAWYTDTIVTETVCSALSLHERKLHPWEIWSPMSASTSQVHPHHQACEALSENCKTVARGSKIFTTAPVSAHRMEHVCF